MPPSLSSLPSPTAQSDASGPRTLRLAILETDPENITVCGSFAQLFDNLFTNTVTQTEEAVENVGLELVNYNVVKGDYPAKIEEFDGMLITGSRANAYDDDKWILDLAAFIRKIFNSSTVRLIGICFGHQIIARALGGTVAPNPAGWEVSVTTLTLDDAGIGALIFPDIAQSTGGLLRIQEMHSDHVTVLPKGVHVFASSPKSPVQGMYVPRKILTFQGHPEFNAEVAEALVDRVIRNGGLTDEQAQDALGRVGMENHGGRLGRRS
ncbi:class I glutamine amidotransferase-like protein [Myxozyma melibiosi]|uniref:Class I glutamine amidotransferase-like protein n=1 Tax=Myxozyma melibiosi TaxID=54550 RepID=A0ABR1EZ28_9ASCO